MEGGGGAEEDEWLKNVEGSLHYRDTDIYIPDTLDILNKVDTLDLQDMYTLYTL